MMKKLQQEEKKDQENPERKAENKNEIFPFAKSLYEIINTTYEVTGIKQAFPQINIDYSYNYAVSIFHPPNI